MSHRIAPPTRTSATPPALWSFCLLLALPGTTGCDSEEPTQQAAPSASADEVVPLETSWQKPRDRLLEPGEEAPNFAGLAHTGHHIRLEQFLHRPTVVYFYPKDGTPGCTAEAEGIRDAWLTLRDKVGMVIGVSSDDNVSHRAFAVKYDLPFILVSDVDHAIARSFGVPVQGGRAQRVSFVIDTDRKVTRVFEDVKPDGHAAELEAALDELSK